MHFSFFFGLSLVLLNIYLNGITQKLPQKAIHSAQTQALLLLQRRTEEVTPTTEPNCKRCRMCGRERGGRGGRRWNGENCGSGKEEGEEGGATPKLAWKRKKKKWSSGKMRVVNRVFISAAPPPP